MWLGDVGRARGSFVPPGVCERRMMVPFGVVARGGRDGVASAGVAGADFVGVFLVQIEREVLLEPGRAGVTLRRRLVLAFAARSVPSPDGVDLPNAEFAGDGLRK